MIFLALSKFYVGGNSYQNFRHPSLAISSGERESYCWLTVAGCYNTLLVFPPPAYCSSSFSPIFPIILQPMLMKALLIILAAALTISDAFIVKSAPTNQPMVMFVSSGFSFTDGQQILVSAQRPLGIVLEQDESPGDIVATNVESDGSAAAAGVKEGDVLLAVQNASVENASLDEVLAFIGNAPKVVNMRFLRRDSD
eukprot:scaffold4244_cov109-Skeletonema_marinoi.AAC.2